MKGQELQSVELTERIFRNEKAIQIYVAYHKMSMPTMLESVEDIEKCKCYYCRRRRRHKANLIEIMEFAHGKERWAHA